MRDATCESTHCLNLLTLPQLRFKVVAHDDLFFELLVAIIEALGGLAQSAREQLKVAKRCLARLQEHEKIASWIVRRKVAESK